MQTTCKRGSNAILRHNKLRDILGGMLPQCKSVGPVGSRCRAQHRPLPFKQADILVQDWDRGNPVAFDISTLNSNVLFAVGATAGAASEAAELRKHTTNDTKCTELVHSSCGGVLRGMGQGGSTLFS